jgi:hypothetical protein
MQRKTFPAILLCLGFFGLAGVAGAPTGAAGAFLAAWGPIQSYTVDIKAHEVKGSSTQDRTYNYKFLKPHFATILVTDGPGKGSGGTWKGGDTVSGHQGGFLSGIHMNVDKHDARATDLRGYTLDGGSFQAMADAITAAASVTNGEETWNGTVYETVSIPFSDGEGATKRTLFLSKTTHLPVRRVTYAGDVIVFDEAFTNLNTAANLKESDF